MHNRNKTPKIKRANDPELDKKKNFVQCLTVHVNKMVTSYWQSQVRQNILVEVFFHNECSGFILYEKIESKERFPELHGLFAPRQYTLLSVYVKSH